MHDGPSTLQNLYNYTCIIVSFLTNTAIGTFRTFPIPNDGFLVQSLSCSGYNISGNISQCSLQFTTGCSGTSSNAAGLRCEGIQLICNNMMKKLEQNGTLLVKSV